MANLVYDSFKADIGSAIDWDDNGGTTIKVMLVTSTYVPLQAHNFKDDITNEVTGTGYTAGGIALPNRSVAVDAGNHWGVYDGDDIVWTTSSITARGAVIYKDTGVAGTSPLVAYIDFGSDKTSASGDFTIQWSTDGIFTIA